MCIRIDAIDGRIRERGFIAEADLKILETQFVLSNGRELNVFVVGAAFQGFLDPISTVVNPHPSGRLTTSLLNAPTTFWSSFFDSSMILISDWISLRSFFACR